MAAPKSAPDARATIDASHRHGHSLRDLDIRQALRLELGRFHIHDAQTVVVEELELCLNAARVDLAVVNGRIEGFEIKSDRDRLDRLARQAEVYSRVFDRITVVAGARHVANVLDATPHWWGAAAAEREQGGQVRLRTVRAATANPEQDPYSVAQLLWRDEALRILDELEALRGLRSKPLQVLWQALADVLTLEELGARVRAAIIAREDWRVPLSSPAGDGSSQRRARSSGCRSDLPPHRRR